MRNKINKYELFFSNLFPQVILRNEIVSTIVYVVGVKLQILKDKIDKHLDTDI